ncbi:Condensin complex subunit 2 [Eufriesea mexicana]|uniref:Condensin complex subunit 2 n=1 Tax=Eufriesea mexicana TaxID=516756 RepID=A0A310S410_9HYME|nr:Condensin complex subunit 2 [Eufriesea mexicana]OAD46991.1 Condensin complex subunit 2 [Eufriesea mexicana]
MATRKSTTNILLNSTIHSTSTSSSPLRRKSMLPQSSSNFALSENNDEAERLARRREIIDSSMSTPISLNDRRRSLGLGFLVHMPPSQMAERISQCIKLGTENKINPKNAFSLEMIDFMTYMIKKKDANMSNLQVATTSLDVSTKIYGFRVDGVHMDILQMIGGLDKQNKNNENKSNVEEMDCQEGIEDSQEKQKLEKKKKKRNKQRIFTTVEALKMNVETEKPSLITMEADLQTTDMLYQAMLPNHANSKFYPHPYNDILVDTVNNKDMQDEEENINRCAMESNQVENIVDFRKVLTTTVPSKVSEYTFIQKNLSIHWAGPSHWKVTNFKRALFNNNVQNKLHLQQAKKKKEIELCYDNETIERLNIKFLPSQAAKLLARTAKVEWNEEILTLPPDKHYDIIQASKLYLHSTMLENPRNKSATSLSDDMENYNYTNENDTSNYALNKNGENNKENEDDMIVNGMTYEVENMSGLQMPFTGDNLVAIPKLTNKLSIGYSIRPKKIDMRQLKYSIWKCLKDETDENVEEPVTKKAMRQDIDKINGNKHFTDIYNKLPRILTKTNIEALSFPISFVSLLHLANEKTLKINSSCDMTDLIIEQN